MIKYYLENPTHELRRATEGSSGFDLRYDGSEREITPGTRWLASTGLYLEMPIGIEAQVRSRSGLAINHGVIVLNAPGTIDSDYRGEVKVSLINLGQQSWVMRPGDRIAQLVFAEIYHEFGMIRIDRLSQLSHTARGEGGHGSTGR